jgi:SSS family solute:Na+ symporter
MGIIAAGFFKLLIPFLCIVPGMAAGYILNIDAARHSDTAFAALTRALVPAGYGLVGLVMAGLVGGIISTVDSMLNSSATLFTFDIYRKYLDPAASERRLIWVGRISMMVLVVISVSLSLMFKDNKGGIFNTMADYIAYLVPGVLVAFLAGIFQKSVTPSGAVACIITGPVASVLLEVGAKMFLNHELQHFHRAGLATVVSYVVLMVVSLLTARERSSEREQYLWWTYRHDPADAPPVGRRWWQSDVTWAVILAAATLGLCWYFA